MSLGGARAASTRLQGQRLGRHGRRDGYALYPVFEYQHGLWMPARRQSVSTEASTRHLPMESNVAFQPKATVARQTYTVSRATWGDETKHAGALGILYKGIHGHDIALPGALAKKMSASGCHAIFQCALGGYSFICTRHQPGSLERHSLAVLGFREAREKSRPGSALPCVIPYYARWGSQSTRPTSREQDITICVDGFCLLE